MKKIIINAPICSASGYGEMSRFALDVLKEHQDKFDIYVNVLNWGQTGWIFQDTEKYNYIQELRRKTEEYTHRYGGKPIFDVSLQITIPNEWQQMAAVNIGYTAGIETTHISPKWFQPSEMMDKIITISSFSKEIFLKTIFSDEKGNELRVTTPIDVVHFPVQEKVSKQLDIDFQTDFNFLTVNQWGPRKNIENLITSFLQEFKNEKVGLVIKTNFANDSIMDREKLNNVLETILKDLNDRKCKVYLIHGRLSEEEMNGLYRHPKIKGFVTATHGEGFGMPIFEAMQAELPIIATDWSGHLDFLSDDDKKLFAKVDYDLNIIDKQHVWPGVMEENTAWAFPKLSSLRNKMREVYKDYNRFKSWAKKLAEYNKIKFSKEKVYEDFFYSLGLFFKPEKLEPKEITGISFCIPTHGKRLEKTLKAVKSIQKQNWNNIPYEIIIAGDVDLFKDANGVKLVDLKEDAHNRKAAKLRNAAAEISQYDNIVFCDDDMILSLDWLDKTLEYTKTNGWNVLGNKILNPDGTRHWDKTVLIPRKLVSYDHPVNDKNLMVTSNFFLIRKNIYLLNKWDESKLSYADRLGQGIPEDVQFHLDLRNKNNIILSFNENALVWHNDEVYTCIKVGDVEQTLTKEMISNQIANYEFPELHPRFLKLLKDL